MRKKWRPPIWGFQIENSFKITSDEFVLIKFDYNDFCDKRPYNAKRFKFWRSVQFTLLGVCIGVGFVLGRKEYAEEFNKEFNSV